eukprot:2695460-Prymnesium_polylepis.1
MSFQGEKSSNRGKSSVRETSPVCEDAVKVVKSKRHLSEQHPAGTAHVGMARAQTMRKVAIEVVHKVEKAAEGTAHAVEGATEEVAHAVQSIEMMAAHLQESSEALRHEARVEVMRDLSSDGVLTSSDTLIVLLTKNVLFQPECLVAIFSAVRDDKLVITINVDRGGYDYEGTHRPKRAGLHSCHPPLALAQIIMVRIASFVGLLAPTHRIGYRAPTSGECLAPTPGTYQALPCQLRPALRLYAHTQ